MASTAKQSDDARRTANMQTDAIKDAAYLESNDLQRQQSQQNAAASEEMNQHARDARAEEASALAIAGEYGGGNTQDRGLAVMGLQHSEQLATIAGNASLADEQTRIAAMGASRRAISQINAIQRPSKLGSALAMGSAAASGYAAGSNLSRPTPAKPT